ncbi:3-ketosteroid 9alpha-monooxygenase subunit B [Leucobacter exalbidus]|uniref:3-ketosteroid 9alpha-monooxygenase subunit B n=1 Tax=Leucobacter exalbidus TaxID=662960 RepID=A0A940PTL6_9MICO|nr:ferredoxin--NADP reductase [Leucobacter exalbidus]MBP1325985.1 3-ketosteroid 9alpha-monooxygenase subunit B [Leucobacter exalbidus]
MLLTSEPIVGGSVELNAQAPAEPVAVGPIELHVIDVIEETTEAHSIVFEIPAELADRCRYRSGQFLTLRIPSDLTGSVARSYSLSSSPVIDNHLKVTVKRIPEGYGSNWVCDNVRAGDRVTVLPPAGTFVVRNPNADLLLFAAGSGITPVISILKTSLQEGTGKIVLYYANRDASSVIFDQELSELQARHPERVEVQHWYDSEHGFADVERIVGVAGAHAGADAYLCGPPPFMNTVVEGLKAAGFTSAQIHREVFSSLTGNPFEVVEEPEVDADAASDQPATQATIHLEGETHEVEWPAERTLVDVLLSKGINVPYSCKSGECGSCACHVVSGEVNMAPSEALDQEDIDDGYVLGCQSRPRSTKVEISFG